MKVFIYFTFKPSNIHGVVKDIGGHSLFKRSLGKSSIQSYIKDLFSCSSKEGFFMSTLIVSGFNSIRYSFLQYFFSTLNSKFLINRIFYITRFSFNGCRLKKSQRL